jgi:hypothetical protein
MMQADNRNNGDGEFKGFMERSLPFHMGGDVAKYFVEAGKDFMDLLFRCKFQTTRERKAFIELAHGCIEFKDETHMLELTMYLAGSDSENADRIERFLAGITAGASRTGNTKPQSSGGGIFNNPFKKKQNPDQQQGNYDN